MKKLTFGMMGVLLFVPVVAAAHGGALDELQELLTGMGNVKGCEAVVVDERGVACQVDVCVESHLEERVSCQHDHHGHHSCSTYYVRVCDRYELQPRAGRTFLFEDVVSACVDYGIFNHRVRLVLKSGRKAKLVIDTRQQTREATEFIRDLAALEGDSELKCR